MPKRNHIAEEEVKAIEEARKRTKNKNVDIRLKALLMHAAGKRHKEIAAATEFRATYISELVGKYCRNGLEAIVENHYVGNRRNMSYEEEEAILTPYKKAAEAGQIIETSAIKAAYEKAIGRSLEKDHGIIYRVLARHGWRKIMPRSKHPNKASDEAIAASKKLTSA